MKATIIISDVLSEKMLLVNTHLLCTQTVPSDQYHVILPDLGNFSREEKTLLEEFEIQYPHFSVLRRHRKTRSQLINLAAKQANGELILFVESHCHVNKTWLQDYLDLFADGTIRAAVGGIKTVPTDSWVGQGEEELRKDVFKRIDSSKQSASYFDFHNSAITKECLDALGGLAEYLPIMTEFELGARLHQNGIPIHRFSQNIIWHFNDSTFKGYSRIIRLQGEDKTRMLIKNGETFMNEYFPFPKFMKLLPVLRRTRIPSLFVIRCLIYGHFLAFSFTRSIGLKRASQYFFSGFAMNSHRYGMVKALNWRTKP